MSSHVVVIMHGVKYQGLNEIHLTHLHSFCLKYKEHECVHSMRMPHSYYQFPCLVDRKIEALKFGIKIRKIISLETCVLSFKLH